MTIGKIQKGIGEEQYLTNLRNQLCTAKYNPAPVRRRWIPKPGKPGERRGLGIPTIDDRVVQAAIKQVIEPIFEARFLHVSQGFRPARAFRDAIELIRLTARGNRRDDQGRKIGQPYPWVIEGDIKACFDEIDHHAVMNRVRSAISDRKVIRLIRAILKSGILEECKFLPARTGTPQGGVLSPLLANIALSVIGERYRRWVYPTPENCKPGGCPATRAQIELPLGPSKETNPLLHVYDRRARYTTKGVRRVREGGTLKPICENK